MQDFLRPLLAAAALLVASGCVHIRTPLDENLDETRLGAKVGESHWQSILGLVAWGDGGIQAAARDGDIEILRHADLETLSILNGAFEQRTVHIYGDAAPLEPDESDPPDEPSGPPP